MRVGFAHGPITSLSGGGDQSPTQMTLYQENSYLQTTINKKRAELQLWATSVALWRNSALQATSTALWRKDAPS
eukprot:3281034-Ditylum_brightwellii.AAC.1